MKKSKLLLLNTQIAVVLLMLISAGCQLQKQNSEAEENMKALSIQALEIWNQGDYTLLEDLYSHEIVRHEVNIQEDIVGKKEYEDNVTWVRTAYPDFNVTADDSFVKDDLVVLRWTVKATHIGPRGELPATGKQVHFSGININQVINGKIVEEWVYFNQADVLKQLGFTFTHPSIENNN
jgi:steroid delta-isomerase-like uncharacterized protein